MGNYNAIWAELLALLLGVRLARSLHLPSIIFDMNCQVVVNFVNMGFTPNKYLQSLLDKVLGLVHLPAWTAFVVHVYRKANRCMDLLANMGHLGSFQ